MHNYLFAGLNSGGGVIGYGGRSGFVAFMLQ
jgi:hypothetical protein